jgi:hypothetical protein
MTGFAAPARGPPSAPVENAENEDNRKGEQKANTSFRLLFAVRKKRFSLFLSAGKKDAP